MPFPVSQRVIYQKNPLEEVLCQVQFPPILRIDTEEPAQFQEAIRANYPFYSVKPASMLMGVPPELAAKLPKGFPFISGQPTHEFTSQDKKWTLSLTRDFIALSCSSYKKWEDFRDHFIEPFNILLNQYKPSFFTRIGLRYRNVIRKSTLDLTDVGWDVLLKPWIAGALADPGISADVLHSVQELRFRISDDEYLQAQHALAMDNRDSYLIDADFYNDKQTEPSHAIERLSSLNKQSGFFFRWCINDRLHNAMEPQPVSGN